uniref:Fe2OG dioxygenase domain-containing protein n=1 Tax=Bigelowiella natans TaxID=227086 RepID=A0A6U3GB01_BIGNA|mmetsp:Transcript_1332/g.2003  ORF Transcript_1332/g.2003 Transcript_1332/m.2003 type:complete len:327 (+) Transcript_1332:69-1049(+)
MTSNEQAAPSTAMVDRRKKRRRERDKRLVDMACFLRPKPIERVAMKAEAVSSSIPPKISSSLSKNTALVAPTGAKRKRVEMLAPCDGDMAKGGLEMAEGLSQKLLEQGYKPVIKYMSKDRKSWILHCPGWEKLPKDKFQVLWDSHPPDFNEIMMHGRRVKIPRWQQAYGQSYSFSGTTAIANPNPPKIVEGLMERLNNLITCFSYRMALVNWYAPEHYLGPHHDDMKQLRTGSPIVSISWGQTRTFRIKWDKKRPCPGATDTSLELRSGDLLLMSWDLNRTHKHEVAKIPKRQRFSAGGRINVTLRSFKTKSSNRKLVLNKIASTT